MPKCHKIYPNCIWQVPSEWHTLGFYTALLTKVYWNYATHIVRVCVTPISPQTSKLDPNDKSNLQVHFGSKAMASLYDLLRYHSLTSTDPLLEELIAYLPTRFHSHIFDYIVYEHSSDDSSIRSTLQLLHFILTTQLTFLKYFYFYYSLCNSKIFTTRTVARDIQKGRRPRTTDDPQEGPEALDYQKSPPRRRVPPADPAFPGQSRRETAGATADR